MTTRRRIHAGAILCIALAVVASALPAAAYPRPGQTERVSVTTDGTGANHWAYGSSISADGRYVAFHSPASNLVSGITNDVYDVFVHDRQTGVTQRVSVGSDGTQESGNSYWPSISADGRYVAFWSFASDLVPGITPDRCGWGPCAEVFVHDRQTGATERVSVASDGTEANNPGRDSHSWDPSISADGRYVAFHSWASNLVPEDTSSRGDVFVHDRETGTTERVSVASDGTEANDSSSNASISADGRSVAFFSWASNLVPGDTNGAHDVFVHDRETGSTERVSVATDGTEGNGHSTRATLSADGRYVAFRSFASNLVPSDTNGSLDIFVRDREAGTTERVSVASDGTEGNENPYFPLVIAASAISADGRFVAFQSYASNLVGGDTSESMDIFVHDRETGATERVSVAGDGTEANAVSSWPVISADGRHVAFQSSASNLVGGDTNGTLAVFVRDRGPAVGLGGITAIPEAGQISVAGWAGLSGQVVTSAADPPDDGAPGAEELGAELTGASLAYRPEQEDLAVRLRVASLPSLSGEACVPFLGCVGAGAGAGPPGVLWGLRFDLDGQRYEVRAARSAAAPAEPRFALYRCDPDCAEQAALSGGIGTTGDAIVLSVPLAALGAQEGAVLSGIQAFTAPGETALVTLDDVDLPDATIPAAGVTLGITPAGTPEQAVAFDTDAELSEGRFSGGLDTASLPAGEHRVWARTCLGEVCGAASTLIELG